LLLFVIDPDNIEFVEFLGGIVGDTSWIELTGEVSEIINMVQMTWDKLIITLANNIIPLESIILVIVLLGIGLGNAFGYNLDSNWDISLLCVECLAVLCRFILCLACCGGELVLLLNIRKNENWTSYNFKLYYIILCFLITDRSRVLHTEQ
jgi:hypothetical protein